MIVKTETGYTGVFPAMYVGVHPEPSAEVDVKGFPDNGGPSFFAISVREKDRAQLNLFLEVSQFFSLMEKAGKFLNAPPVATTEGDIIADKLG